MKQSIYEESEIQKYPIGTRFAKDERAWRYAKAGGALLPAWGAMTYMTFPEDATIAAAALAGAKSIICTAQDVVIANHYAGGYAVIWTGATDNLTFYYRIISNTGALAAAAKFTVSLDAPLALALGADATVALYASPFADVRRPTTEDPGSKWSGFGAYVGIPSFSVTEDYYFWLQTWGPCVAIPNEFFGATIDQHMAYFWRDGSMVPSTAAHASENKPCLQIAGPALPFTGPSDDPHDMPELFINLMLFP